jgi:predicted MPP superfamily phosphohydrolase
MADRMLALLPGVLLFAGACAGHITLLVRAINWCYGTILSKFWNHLARLLLALLAVAGPVAFWWSHGFEVPAALATSGQSAGAVLLAGYLVICLAVGFGVLPVVTLCRCLGRPPAALESNHTATLDVAAELGYKPAGRGKHRLLALLPGNEVFRVDFAVRTLRLPQLPPAWDGLTILHLSDLHMCGTPGREFYRKVMERCNDWNPDLIALTGDVVDGKRLHRWIVPVLGRLRCRIAAFAILGNHDSWEEAPLIRRRLRRIGMHVLGNSWKQIEVRDRPMVVIGHEGPWFEPEPDLSACRSGLFRLCLSHTPDNIGWARRHGIDLMLSGHVHGGQIRFPVLGSVFVPSRFGRRYDCGTFHEPPTLLHVSRGLGGEHPLRYNCRPEVTQLVLRCA